MALPEGKLLVAQGGGPTAVINQSLVGAVLEAKRYANVTHVYGALNGVRGIVNEDFLDLTQATTKNLEAVAATPSSGMLSTRDKPDEAYCHEIFKVCQAHNIRYFLYCGGNDSADTCRILSEESQKTGYDLRVVHVPKTIDNDLLVTDHCPGFGSAAKFVAQAFAGAALDNRALPGVYIGVVMGRNAGFLTAAASLAVQYPDDGPHLIYLPERPFTKEQFIRDVKAANEKYGRCVIAVSEGIADSSGKAIVEQFTGGEKDAHGNAQLSGTGALGDLLAGWVKEGAAIKRVRADTLGYLQRSFLGCVSSVDQEEARAAGQKAAECAAGRGESCSIAIVRVGDYVVDFQPTTLQSVARKTKHMPEEFINAEGNNVTEAFKNYCRPLIGGMPKFERIHAPKVDKILKK